MLKCRGSLGREGGDDVADEACFCCGRSQAKLRRCRKGRETGKDSDSNHVEIMLEFSRVVRNVSGEGKQMHLLAMMLRKSTKKFESTPNPPGFHGHILYHLADKGCGNLSVILGMVLLRYNRGLARWLTHHHVITEAGMRMP